MEKMVRQVNEIDLKQTFIKNTIGTDLLTLSFERDLITVG